MNDRFFLDTFKKTVRSNWVNKSGLGKFLFFIKDIANGVFSAWSLFFDHILFVFKQDNIKSLYRQSEFTSKRIVLILLEG